RFPLRGRAGCRGRGFCSIAVGAEVGGLLPAAAVVCGCVSSGAGAAWGAVPRASAFVSWPCWLPRPGLLLHRWGAEAVGFGAVAVGLGFVAGRVVGAGACRSAVVTAAEGWGRCHSLPCPRRLPLRCRDGR